MYSSLWSSNEPPFCIKKDGEWFLQTVSVWDIEFDTPYRRLFENTSARRIPFYIIFNSPPDCARSIGSVAPPDIVTVQNQLWGLADSIEVCRIHLLPWCSSACLKKKPSRLRCYFKTEFRFFLEIFKIKSSNIFFENSKIFFLEISKFYFEIYQKIFFVILVRRYPIPPPGVGGSPQN